MFRFIHAADLHLDSPLLGLERYAGAPVEAMRSATRRALENLVQLALDRRVDFVVIAGDLYDGDWKDYHTGLFFSQQMGRLAAAEIPVVMIAGNHDAASRMTRSLRLPEHVELLPPGRAATAQNPRLRSLGVAVHGRSFAEAAETQNMVPEYPAAVPGVYNIGLLHSSLVGTEGHDPYAPCSLDDLRSKNYDYWALGHIHLRAIMSQDPWVVYSGNTQGRHVRECGAKGCYLVTVNDFGVATLEFEPLDVIRWEVCRLAVDELESLEELYTAFAQQLRHWRKQHPGFPLALRVVLSGVCSFQATLLADEERVTQELRAVANDVAPGELWLEKVQIKSTALTDEGSPRLGEGPVAAIREYVQQLPNRSEELALLLTELADLKRKLPHEVLESLGDFLRADSPEVTDWLAGAEATILRQMGARQAE